MRPVVGGGKVRQKRPGGFPGVRPTGQKGATPGGFDYAAFNAWQDPNIGGQQPGPIQEGWGGFGALDTMTGTKMNNYLNQQPTGGPRETMMNQLGYFNQGNPFTPQVPRGYNRGLRSKAQANQQAGSYSSPGTYQHMSTPAAMSQPGYAGDPYSIGGYTGITNVDQSGAAQYTPFDVNARGGGRIRRRGGTIGSRY